MIVPQNRLLFWFAAVVPAFVLLSAMEPAATPVAFVCLGTFLALLVTDAVAGIRSLGGIAVQLPAVVRMSKNRATNVELRIRNQKQQRRSLRLGLALPLEVTSAQEDLRVLLPAGSEWSRLTWPCTPAARGNHRVTAAHIEICSPLGFWAARRRLMADCVLRVYPNLLEERRNLAALFLNRGAFGVHAQRQIGKGRDFEKLREYVPGDGYEDLHWKATARRGRPITKVFQIEKTQEVYVVIDASRLTARQPERETIGCKTTDPRQQNIDNTIERFMTAALMLGLAAERQGDLFGLITFSNKIERFVRAKNGKTHYGTCRDALYTLEPRLVSPDFDELCTFIRLRLRRRSLLFFLTALDDAQLAASFVRNVDLIRRQHLVLVNMLQPPGVEPVFSNPNATTLDRLYQHLGGHLQWHKLRELEKVLQRRGVQFSLLQNERLSAELVSQYLNVKQRQLL